MTNDNTPVITDDILTWWRTKSPHDLAPAHGKAKELIDHLAQVTKPTTDHMKELLPDAINEVSGAALSLGCLLIGKEGYAPDLAMSWVLVAALLDDAAAQLFVAHELVRSTSDDFYLFDEWGCPIDEDETTRKLTSTDIKKLRIARDWALQIPPVNKYRKYMARELAYDTGQPQKETTLLERRQQLRQREDALSGKPSLRVMEQIGDPTNRESKDLIKAYSQLTTPLPLVGASLQGETLEHALNAEFPWMRDVTRRIVGDMRLMQICGSPWFRFRPILLVGPAGCGKTRYAAKLAQLAGTGFGVVNAGGSSDNRTLAGTARGWSSTQPALPLQIMSQSKCANPIIVVDEIDKAGGSNRNGKIHDTLLSMLEPETARAWFDEALLGTADLRQISWVMTANDITWMPRPLLSRVAIFEIDEPDGDAFDGIITGIRTDLASEFYTQPASLPELHPRAHRALRQAFVKGCSIRKLKTAYVSGISQVTEDQRILH